MTPSDEYAELTMALWFFRVIAAGVAAITAFCLLSAWTNDSDVDNWFAVVFAIVAVGLYAASRVPARARAALRARADAAIESAGR